MRVVLSCLLLVLSLCVCAPAVFGQQSLWVGQYVNTCNRAVCCCGSEGLPPLNIVANTSDSSQVYYVLDVSGPACRQPSTATVAITLTSATTGVDRFNQSFSLVNNVLNLTDHVRSQCSGLLPRLVASSSSTGGNSASSIHAAFSYTLAGMLLTATLVLAQ